MEGDERKKPLDLLSVEVCIHAPVGLLAQAHFGSLHLYRAHSSDGALCSQQPRFMPQQFVILPPFLHRRRRIFGLRSAGSGENSNSNQNDDTDGNPLRRNAEQICGDRKADDENYETDEVRTER